MVSCCLVLVVLAQRKRFRTWQMTWFVGLSALIFMVLWHAIPLVQEMKLPKNEASLHMKWHVDPINVIIQIGASLFASEQFQFLLGKMKTTNQPLMCVFWNDNMVLSTLLNITHTLNYVQEVGWARIISAKQNQIPIYLPPPNDQQHSAPMHSLFLAVSLSWWLHSADNTNDIRQSDFIKVKVKTWFVLCMCK